MVLEFELVLQRWSPLHEEEAGERMSAEVMIKRRCKVS